MGRVDQLTGAGECFQPVQPATAAELADDPDDLSVAVQGEAQQAADDLADLARRQIEDLAVVRLKPLRYVK